MDILILFSTIFWTLLWILSPQRESIVKCMVMGMPKVFKSYQESILLPGGYKPTELNYEIIKPPDGGKFRRVKYSDLASEYSKIEDNALELQIYEPYWKDGDWVFNVNSLKKKGLHPGRTTHRPKGDSKIEQSCLQHCLKIYIGYGNICAHRFDVRKWRYEYKHFDDMCEMETENCRKEKSRPMWYPAHRGQCQKSTTYRYHPTNLTAILNFKNKVASVKRDFTNRPNIHDRDRHWTKKN